MKSKIVNAKEATRQCRCCGETKNIFEFEIKKTFLDGSRRYTHRCKKCKNAYEQLRIRRNKGENIPEELYEKYLTKKNLPNLYAEEMVRYDVKEILKDINKNEKIGVRSGRVRRRFSIDNDLAKKLDETTSEKSDLVNMLLRNHFRL